MSRELRGDQLRLRAAGMDWPLHGLTMVGLAGSTISRPASSRSSRTASRAT